MLLHNVFNWFLVDFFFIIFISNFSLFLSRMAAVNKISLKTDPNDLTSCLEKLMATCVDISLKMLDKTPALICNDKDESLKYIHFDPDLENYNLYFIFVNANTSKKPFCEIIKKAASVTGNVQVYALKREHVIIYTTEGYFIFVKIDVASAQPVYFGSLYEEGVCKRFFGVSSLDSIVKEV